MLIALAVALGVQMALCAVLVAIHFQELWLPAVLHGEMEMQMVPPEKDLLEQEEEPPPSQPVNMHRPVSALPFIASRDDLLEVDWVEPELAMEMDEVTPEIPDSEFLPEELAQMQLTMKEQPKPRTRASRKPAVSMPGEVVQNNVTPDEKVRYKFAPSLPNSVNSSKVGKVNAVVKVTVGVNARGEPSSVDLLQSTGNAELDRLFIRWVKENWTFHPAKKDGVPMASKVVVPVRLKID